MKFKTMFPELGENQLRMLERIISEEIIGEDDCICDEYGVKECDSQWSLKTTQREALRKLLS